MTVRPWTQDEDAYLRKHYGKQRIQDIARALNRSYNQVRYRARLLGLRKPRHLKSSSTRWSRKDEEFLLEHWEKMSVSELAQHLGRSPRAVRHKIRRLRLRESGEAEKPRGASEAPTQDTPPFSAQSTATSPSNPPVWKLIAAVARGILQQVFGR